MNAQEYLEHWKQGEAATRRKPKSTDHDLRLTIKHGGIIHTLESLDPGMVAKTKCGLVLVQWRDADSTGRNCKRCK